MTGGHFWHEKKKSYVSSCVPYSSGQKDKGAEPDGLSGQEEGITGLAEGMQYHAIGAEKDGVKVGIMSDFLIANATVESKSSLLYTVY